jgi:hypothetical protein
MRVERFQQAAERQIGAVKKARKLSACADITAF